MSQDQNLVRNPDYYAARAVEERRLAMASADDKARAIHFEMADKYDRLAAGGESTPPPVIGESQTKPAIGESQAKPATGENQQIA